MARTACRAVIVLCGCIEVFLFLFVFSVLKKALRRRGPIAAKSAIRSKLFRGGQVSLGDDDLLLAGGRI
jgi:hypothetical protein